MAWVVDTCLLIDIADGDPKFAAISADLLNRHGREGLVICPISYAEFGPVFNGQQAPQDRFLDGLNIRHSEPWLMADTIEAHAAWSCYVRQRRIHGLAKRPLADILIGAFTRRFEGLLTRNPVDFKSIFTHLRIETP